MTLDENTVIERSQVNNTAYQNHRVFELIDKMKDYYDGLAETSFSFIPNGTLTFGNYETYVYMSISSTLDSIKTLLKAGHISDAFVLIRKLFDTILMEIYFHVMREEKYDWMKSLVVKELDEWIKGERWIPRIGEIQKVLKESKTTKELYPWFPWDTKLKKIRDFLDNHVHASSYRSILLNCPTICIDNRAKQLENAYSILHQIMVFHLAFLFYLDGPYMMAYDYMDYRDCGMEPPEGSESWLASYAQEAFDVFLKPHDKFAAFIKERCVMEIK